MAKRETTKGKGILALLLVLLVPVSNVPAASQPDDGSQWVNGYLVEGDLWLNEGGVRFGEVLDDSCRFVMCSFPVGSWSKCREYNTYFGDITYLFEGQKVEPIRYNLKTKTVKKQ